MATRGLGLCWDWNWEWAACRSYSDEDDQCEADIEWHASFEKVCEEDLKWLVLSFGKGRAFSVWRRRGKRKKCFLILVSWLPCKECSFYPCSPYYWPKVLLSLFLCDQVRIESQRDLRISWTSGKSICSIHQLVCRSFCNPQTILISFKRSR